MIRSRISKGSNQTAVYKFRRITQCPTTDWNRKVYIQYYKGDLTSCENYCSISLISPARKIMLQLIHYKLKPTWKGRCLNWLSNRLRNNYDPCWKIGKLGNWHSLYASLIIERILIVSITSINGI